MSPSHSNASSIAREPYGYTPAGVAVERYNLRNARGMEAQIATYGGTVTRLTAADRDGRYADVVLGYDSLDGYLHSSAYFGALVGRYANRIARGRFRLRGVSHTLAINDSPNSLHGGCVGFDKVVWTVTAALVAPQGPQLTLHYLSLDGEEGYPGNLSVHAVYTLTEDDALRLEYAATTDADTVINLTHHSYFDLRGSGDVRGTRHVHPTGDVLGHLVTIPADLYTPVDSTLIPTGELQSVAGTPFDFRKATAIGARIAQANQQLIFAGGYDHNWVINKEPGQLGLVATIDEPAGGRRLEVYSTQPGLQFYSGNALDGSIIGKQGHVYERRSGLAVEPQHFPDSPNHPDFPSTTLHPGEIYRNTIEYRFSAT